MELLSISVFKSEADENMKLEKECICDVSSWRLDPWAELRGSEGRRMSQQQKSLYPIIKLILVPLLRKIKK